MIDGKGLGGGMVGGGPRSGLPGGGGRGTGRLRGVGRSSYSSQTKIAKTNLRDTLKGKKLASTPKSKIAMDRMVKDAKKKVAQTNKNASRSRSVVSTSSQAGTRRTSTRTSPRPSVKTKVTKKVLMPGGNSNIKTVKTTLTTPRNKKTILDHAGKEYVSQLDRKKTTGYIKVYELAKKQDIKHNRTTAAQRVERDLRSWKNPNIPKNVRKDAKSRNAYLVNKTTKQNKRKLNRIVTKGGL